MVYHKVEPSLTWRMEVTRGSPLIVLHYLQNLSCVWWGAEVPGGELRFLVGS